MNALAALAEYDERFPPPLGEGIDLTSQADRFKLVDWNDVEFNPNEEWLVDDVLPLRGFGLIYGKPRSFKSFTALDLAVHVVLGTPWAGRRISRGKVVYIAAEGAAGMRKRIEACKMRFEIPRGDFALIESAPNLGIGDGDLAGLIAAVKGAGVAPSLIAIDTASKSIGAAEENGTGMAAFIGNAERLARHFDCLVLGVHHVGLGEDAQKRPRGWSGLGGALDVQILCERPGDEKRTTLTVQKLKDEEDGISFEAHLSRVVVGVDKNGKEASTLIVDEVVETEPPAAKEPAGRRIPPSQRLLSQIIAQAIEEAGQNFRPFPDGPLVRGVCDEQVREQYYTAIAEPTDPDQDPRKVAARKRQAFNRGIKAELDTKRLCARMSGKKRLLWLP